ncbi:hypothetical protein XH94_03485 [Bradyrhizobium zhanjiangense]|uniref:Uncharacterized protein n=1 Tax=Bradyrhizobium zhanjiangense TaxID=1325107 RepID=A0A4Q0SQR1_9BRAD|nr:hypothetical protein XH94_03485 [Bradyrhizobium zhanjiangense]
MGTTLHIPPPGPQNFAVTIAHQREAGLHQADPSITQIVGLPGAIWDAFLAEQYFGDDAIACARAVRVERTDRSPQAVAPLFRQLMKSRTWRASIYRAPQPARCMCPSKSLSNGSSAAYDAPSTGGSLDQTR